jgi:hypothetical protein
MTTLGTSQSSQFVESEEHIRILDVDVPRQHVIDDQRKGGMVSELDAPLQQL